MGRAPTTQEMEAMNIREAFAELGFELYGTGGGCEAFAKFRDDGTHTLVTAAGDPSVPVFWSEDCGVGEFDGEADDNDAPGCEYRSYATVKRCIHALRQRRERTAADWNALGERESAWVLGSETFIRDPEVAEQLDGLMLVEWHNDADGYYLTRQGYDVRQYGRTVSSPEYLQHAHRSAIHAATVELQAAIQKLWKLYPEATLGFPIGLPTVERAQEWVEHTDPGEVPS